MLVENQTLNEVINTMKGDEKRLLKYCNQLEADLSRTKTESEQVCE